MTEINMEQYVNIVLQNFAKEEIKVVMEVGSLNGADSLYFKSIFPESRVVAIEGLQDNYDKYMKHLETIESVNAIVCDYDGVATYHKKKINGIHGIFNRGDEYGTETLRNQPCKTLKTLCGELAIDRIDMMKIDVEGATYQVLLGMADLLPRVKIMHLETESHEFFQGQTLHDQVSKYLEDRNFEMVQFSSVEILSGKKQHDSVWINRNK